MIRARSLELVVTSVLLMASVAAAASTVVVVSTGISASGWASHDPYFDAVSGNGAGSDLLDFVYGCEFDANQHRIDQRCESLVTDYFGEELIWVSAQPQNRLIGGTRGLAHPVLNPRNSTVLYAYDDYLMDDLPQWGDVFDGHIQERNALVAQVMKDTTCSSLASVDGGINPHLARRCESVELFKYAALLDACVTSMVRLKYLSRARSPKFSEDYLETRREKLRAKSHLREAWIHDMCRRIPLVAITPDAHTADGTSLMVMAGSAEELEAWTQEAHDVALRIAAKAGSVWAMVSYLPQGESMDYWQDLLTINPSLAHRFLAAIGPGLSEDERLRHAAHSYRMIENPEIKPFWYLDHIFTFDGGVDIVARFKSHIANAGEDGESPALPWTRRTEATDQE